MTKSAQLTEVLLDRRLASFNRLWQMFMESESRIQKSGGKVVAKWRLFPPEIIYALGATPYDLLLHEGMTKTTTKDARTTAYAIEAGLSADSCIWNLTATSNTLSKGNLTPLNMFVATAGQCDISSKTWQLMSRNMHKPIYSMEIPIYDVASEKRAISFIKEELTSLFERVGRRFGHKYSERNLREEIKRGNRIRKLLLDLTGSLTHDHVPMTGLEYFLTHATAGDYLQEPEALTAILTEIRNEVMKRTEQSEAAPGITNDPVRLYYVGMAPQDLRFWNIIEDSGGAIVGSDTYLPLFYSPIPENGSLLKEFAGWIWKMPHHMPSLDRAKSLIPYIKQQKPDAIIIGNVIGCRNLSSSDRIIKETFREELGIPVTSIEFGSSEDVTLLEPHIKAFVEICK